ncbi:hypothetical protein Q0F99_01735 [Rathayibacter oskolensis]|uniref:hypothetical protein n=1 Tax=Rathayibacter oskolensis TaxID=1891671 RepID=UPI00265EBA68|nr:hypothetical protein [Rathayibacter oskolensis]WKK71896.1 hypothetical protein Q0F99_01735 [Rathayibacter oskolensis]
MIVAFVLYFAFVLPINHLKNAAFKKKMDDAPAAEDKAPTELELLADIRDLLANGGTATTANSGKHVDWIVLFFLAGGEKEPRSASRGGGVTQSGKRTERPKR